MNLKTAFIAGLCYIALGTIISACALLGGKLDRAAEGAGDLVTFYCANITDPTVREQFRAAVNTHAAPNTVSVTCFAGGPPLDTATLNSAERSSP